MVELPIREDVCDGPLGVLTTCTPVRPNPIAVQMVEIHAVRDCEIGMTGLDCLDRTPVLDIKRRR